MVSCVSVTPSKQPMVLIVRPTLSAMRSSVVFKEQGFDVHVDSVLTIIPCVHTIKAFLNKESLVQAYDGVVMTSVNGLECLLAYPLPSWLLDLPFYGAGKTSAMMAEKAKFKSVWCPKKPGVFGIAEHVVMCEKKNLLYLRGDVIAKDFDKLLDQVSQHYQKSPPKITEKILYHTRENESFSAETLCLIKNQKITHIHCCSDRTKKVVMRLLDQYELLNECIKDLIWI